MSMANGYIENASLGGYENEANDLFADMKAEFFEMMDKAVDSHIHNAIRSAIEADGNKHALAIIDLLAEYGIYGRTALDFVNKLQKLEKKFGKKESKE